MNITHRSIAIREIFEGYKDNQEEGVTAFNGKLNVRPPYQREFVYDDKKRNAVIETIKKGFPLNVMYWAKNEDDSYEVLDGQQRTISFCQYLNGDFSVDNLYFYNLTDVDQSKILNYEVEIYICEGNDKERLDWFETINIAGEKLTKQELRNINYTGKWLSDAKRKFSKTNCVAYKIGSKYLKGSPIRQEYLETALSWISHGDIEGYMALHQKEDDASELWNYYTAVIDWITKVFPPKYYRKEMQGLDWGRLYEAYHKNEYSPEELEKKVKGLILDDEVTNKRGIFEYLLSGCTKESCLSLRKFSDAQKLAAYEKQKGICPICGKKFQIEDMDGDHIVPWSQGGKTTPDNLQLLCRTCNLKKGAKK